MPLSIKGFLETSFRDWDGLVSAVIFVPNCNWRCVYCHNHPLVYQPQDYPDIPSEVVIGSLKRYSEWIDGLCVGGGEPTLNPELIPFLEKIKALGLKVKIDTNASQPQMLTELLERGLVDYIAIDIKAPLDDKAYSNVCRKKVEIDKIRESLSIVDKAFKENRLEYELRTTVAPPFFNEDVIVSICKEISFTPRYVLQQFDADSVREEDKQDCKPYSSEEITAWAKKAREFIKDVRIREV